MSMKMEDDIKRWTAKRKSALVLDIIQGKTTVAEASRQYDLSPSEVEQWVDDGKRGVENALRANPQDVREPAQGPSRGLRRGDAGASHEKKIVVPAGRGREVIETIHQGLQADGITVSIAKLYRWFNMPRRTVNHKAVKASPKLDPQSVAPTKALICQRRCNTDPPRRSKSDPPGQ